MSKTQGRRINNTKWSVLARANAVGIKAETIVESDQESGHPRIDFKIILIHLLIVSLFAGLIYSPSVGFPFTFVDAYITGPFASKLRETNFWHELVLQSFLNPLYQPWLKASFAQDLSYSAASASSFRLINVGLHVVNCMLLYILTFRVHRHIYSGSTQQKNPDQKVSLYLVAFLTSILFACHPLTSQSVAYIAGRGGVLTGLNILLALNFFLLGLWKNQAFPICTGYLGAAVFSLLAIETSPDGFAAPMLLLLATALLYTSVKEKKVSAERKWELAILSALTIFITIAATQLAAANEFSNNFGLIGLNPIAYLASQFRGFLFYYLRCALFPAGLSIEPPWFIAHSLLDPTAILGMTAFSGIAFLAWKKRTATLLSFALSAILVAYLPSLLIFRTDYGSDERFYFPLAMICVLCAMTLRALCRRNRRIYISVAVLFVMLLSALTLWRESAWKSTLSIWQNADNLKRTTYSSAMVSLYEVEGENAEIAKRKAEEILKTDSECQPANFALGKWYFLRREYLAAKPYLFKSLKLCDEQHLNNFTRYQCTVSCLDAFVALDDYSLPPGAITYLLQNYPESNEVNYLAGKIAMHHKKSMLAVGYLNKAFSCDKKNPDYALALGEACLDSRDPTLVRNAYRTLRPMSHRIPSPQLRLLFGLAALEVGRPDECLTAMDQTISMFSTAREPLKSEFKGECHYLRSVALNQLGRSSESEEAKEAALKLDPKVSTRVDITVVKNRQ